MKVLIADDEAISRRLLQGYLERWGHEVVMAQNGAEAWNLFMADEFSIVISDWTMPEMDGVELIRRIRACQRSGYVYTILLTAKSQKEDIVEGMEAGADDFVTKPFDRDELRVRVVQVRVPCSKGKTHLWVFASRKSTGRCPFRSRQGTCSSSIQMA